MKILKYKINTILVKFKTNFSDFMRKGKIINT